MKNGSADWTSREWAHDGKSEIVRSTELLRGVVDLALAGFCRQEVADSKDLPLDFRWLTSKKMHPLTKVIGGLEHVREQHAVIAHEIAVNVMTFNHNRSFRVLVQVRAADVVLDVFYLAEALRTDRKLRHRQPKQIRQVCVGVQWLELNFILYGHALDTLSAAILTSISTGET